MGSLKGVEITRGSTGPNNIGPATSPSAFLVTGYVVAGKLAFNTVYKINSLKDAEALGITSDYDTTNACVLHEHIADFYSYKKNEGVDVYIMVVDAAAATTPADYIEDTGEQYSKKLLIAAGHDVRQLGFIYNLPVGATETLTNGMNSNIVAAIPKAQLLADWAYNTDRPCHVVLEGRGISDTLSTLGSMRNIVISSAVLNADDVSVVIAQDWDYAEGRTGLPRKYAGVGKKLGALAAADMNQCTGEVAVFNLSNATTGKWVTGGLSNHKKITDVESSLQVLDDKGYNFVVTYPGVSGLRFNNDHNCTPIVIDADGNINPHMTYFSRTLSEAARALKIRFLSRLKSRVNVDSTTGLLPGVVIKNLEGEGDDVFATMTRSGYISDGRTTVDPSSDLITPPKSLLVDFEIVPVAILDNVVGTIRLKKSFTV